MHGNAPLLPQDAAELTPPPSLAWPGEVIRRRYRLEQPIGRGGTGSVWRATHLGYGVPVAVKLLAREHLRSEVIRRRFSQEARAAARLRSRFVVRTFETGETEGGVPFSVMELLNGETLEDNLARERRIPLGAVVRFTVQVARALSLAHARGIVHRDVKPSNVFVHESGEPGLGRIAKLIDFGVAKLTRDSDRSWSTTTGMVLGTPAYMSPEQALGMPWVDHRSDLYSLGMLVFHLLTGETAYRGAGYGQVLLSVCTQPLPSLSAHLRDVPAALDDWFKKACAREPGERFQRAQDLARALLDASGDGGRLDQFFGIGSPPPHPLDVLRATVPEDPPTLVGLARPADEALPIPLVRARVMA